MTKSKWYKKTFIYRFFERNSYRKKVRTWTAQDQEMLTFYRRFVSPGDVCFDVGANMGNRVKVFLELGAKVVAVEPQRRCAEMLQTGFGRHPDFTLLSVALGSEEGVAEMKISKEHTLSSLSTEWIEAVQESGRFAQYSWDEVETVPITTLDSLVKQYGVPSFVKIDVEGFEFQVVSGLSVPLKSLSLEFTPEYIESTVKAIAHLASLGEIKLNYSVGESMTFVREDWLSSEEMISLLRGLKIDNDVFGDVYIQFVS